MTDSILFFSSYHFFFSKKLYWLLLLELDCKIIFLIFDLNMRKPLSFPIKFNIAILILLSKWLFRSLALGIFNFLNCEHSSPFIFILQIQV